MPKKTKKRLKIEELYTSYCKDNKIADDKAALLKADDALAWIKHYSEEASKFDESIEVHLKIGGIDPRNPANNIVNSAHLPHGTGKENVIIAFVDEQDKEAALEAGASYAGAESLIAAVKSGECVNFDICVAHQSLMPKIAAELGKLLGPKGLMPNPKLGTVSNDVPSMVKAMKLGRAMFRSDKFAIIHSTIGRLRFDNNSLRENLKALVGTVHKSLPAGGFLEACYLTTTQGPFSSSVEVKDLL